jgi:hypothetical protein
VGCHGGFTAGMSGGCWTRPPAPRGRRSGAGFLVPGRAHDLSDQTVSLEKDRGDQPEDLCLPAACGRGDGLLNHVYRDVGGAPRAPAADRGIWNPLLRVPLELITDM